MPTIYIASPLTAPGELIVLMMYPDDEALRAKAYLLDLIRFRVDTAADDEHITLSRKEMLSLIETPDFATLRRQQAERTKKGLIAGDVLLAMYIMDRFNLGASMNKAVWAIQAYAKEATYADGSPLVTSESAIRDCWRQFGPVAHLWAAVRVNIAYPYAPEKEIFGARYLPTFLAVAAGIRQFGTTFVPHRARPPAPILDAQKSWALPENVVPLRLTSERFPTRLVELLKGYKAPQPLPP